MIEIFSGKKTGKAIATLAIGKEYLSKWEKNALPLIIKYCSKNELGLYVRDQSIDTKSQEKINMAENSST
jgi:hypothetical protein